MQPWARHGYRAAVLTGGMPATTPWVGEDTASHGEFVGDLCTAGSAQSTSRQLSGTLDARPDLAGRHRRKPPRRPGRGALAGWIIDTGRPGVADEPVIGSPSEGFHRSLSWTGAVDAAGRDEEFPPHGALVVPLDDPAVVTGFDEAGSIMELWEGLVGQELRPADAGPSEVGHDESGPTEFRPSEAAASETGVVAPEDVNLTAGTLATPPSEVYTVPCELVDAVLTTAFRPLPPRQDFLPLTLPGDYQERAHEVPRLASVDYVHRPPPRWPDAPRGWEADDSTVPLFGGRRAPPSLTDRLEALINA